MLGHYVRTYCNISRTFTASWSDNVRCPTVISTTEDRFQFVNQVKREFETQSGNSPSPLEAQNKDIGADSRKLLAGVKNKS